MAVLFPELDNDLSGASATWDAGLAGVLFDLDYFTPAAVGGGQLKVWNGTAWVAKPVKVWNGTAWVTKPVKVWNGTAWVTTTY